MLTPLAAHPSLERGVLPNGLRYAILPLAVVPWSAAPWSRRRVAVHLEVHVGSIDEGEHERGYAHLLEHVSFMGSRRRLRLSGTGSRLAALTDFHTTSYSAEVPRRQLSNALAALGEIAFTPQLQPGRVAREQRAVLAEATTLGTTAYRRSQLVLAALHAETLLPRRLPIGDSGCVASATPRALRAFHTAHVTPHRAELYVVGAVTPRRARRLLRRALGGASGGEAGRDGVQRGRPQVRHAWGGAARVAVHEEEGLRAVSVNWLRKRRLRAMRDEAGVREAVLEEVAVEVLRARLCHATSRCGGVARG